jgi:hypothetical protein
VVKGTVSRDFRPSVIFVKLYPWSPDSCFAFRFEFAEIFDDKNRHRAMPRSAESTRKFFIEFHIELHSAELQIKLF